MRRPWSRYKHVGAETGCHTHLQYAPAWSQPLIPCCWALSWVVNSNSVCMTVSICSSVCMCVSAFSFEACTSPEDSFFFFSFFLPNKHIFAGRSPPSSLVNVAMRSVNYGLGESKLVGLLTETWRWQRKLSWWFRPPLRRKCRFTSVRRHQWRPRTGQRWKDVLIRWKYDASSVFFTKLHLHVLPVVRHHTPLHPHHKPPCATCFKKKKIIVSTYIADIMLVNHPNKASYANMS